MGQQVIDLALFPSRLVPLANGLCPLSNAEAPARLRGREENSIATAEKALEPARRAQRRPHGQDTTSNCDREDQLRLIDGLLRGEERVVNPTNAQLLDEIELSSTTVRSAATRTEYRRMQEHFIAFLGGERDQPALAPSRAATNRSSRY